MSKFIPTWGEYEAGMYSDDPEEATRAGELFEEARAKELAISERARAWEKDRKQEWQDNKRYHQKERKTEEQKIIEDVANLISHGGHFMERIKPSNGYVIVQRVKLDSMSQSGIVLPTEYNEGIPNTGVVVDCGDDKSYPNGTVETAPCKTGDKVLYRWGAGLPLTTGQGDVVLMGFGDILGTFITE